MSESSGCEHKKPKIDSQAAADKDKVFSTIGEQAVAVDNQDNQGDVEYISSDTLRNTGAEDAEGRPVQEIDSLCMNCHEQGVTKLLFTEIPGFREIVVMSFECPHCGFKNNEIQAAAEIQEKGSKIVFNVEKLQDLGRQVLKSEHAVCRFPQLDIEIPAGNGRLTTIEGLLSGMKDDLESDQAARKEATPEIYEKIEEVIHKLAEAADGKLLPLTFEIDDTSGNSFVSMQPGEQGKTWNMTQYFRTPDQSRALGMNVPDNAGAPKERQKPVADVINGSHADDNVPKDMREEVQTFHDGCPSCHTEIPTHMKVVNIPHFKDVIIMSTVCDSCGYKSNEVKTGGAVSDKGRKITLKVTEPEDLARDVLKSETCSMRFPELDLDLAPGTLGSRFTSLEGLLQQVYDELENKVLNVQADSMDEETKLRWASFLARLDGARSGQMPFTVEMQDPLAGSYIQNVYAPDADPNMVIEDYDRTNEENDELGLNDINAE